MASAPLTSVVLAAGEGTRMRSTRPKPLHLLCGRAMLLHILDAVAEVPVSRAVVVVGHGAERVTKKLTEQGPPGLVIDFVEQVVQRGTGDALLAGLTAFPDDPDDAEDEGDVLVLPGDTPLLRAETLAAAGYPVRTWVAEDPLSCTGVNDRVQLAAAEAELRRRTNERWLRQGVTMLDHDRTYLDTTVRLAPDLTRFPGVILQGTTVVGERAEVGPDTRLVDCTVGADAVVASTTGVDAEVGAGARVGPFAVLEPGSSIVPGAVTGPFYTSTDRRD